MALFAQQTDAGSAAAGGVLAFFIIVIWFVLLLVGVVLYFLPLIVAIMRKSQNLALVAILDILLGWSLVGWIIALVMAFVDTAPQQITIVNQQQPPQQPQQQQPPPPELPSQSS